MPPRRLPDHPSGIGLRLDRTQLKYIAILAMLLDHVAFLFLAPTSLEYQLFRFIGRCTGPIMAWFVAEGVYYTRNLDAYLRRLGIFALLSWPCYTLAFFSHLPLYRSAGAWTLDPTQGVISCLFLGAMSVTYWEDRGRSKYARMARVFLMLLASIICDHAVVGVLWVLWFHCYKNDPAKKWGLYLVGVWFLFMQSWTGLETSWYMMGYVLAPLLLSRYDGTPGRGDRWFFYLFYPGHLLILGAIRDFLAMRIMTGVSP